MKKNYLLFFLFFIFSCVLFSLEQNTERDISKEEPLSIHFNAGFSLGTQYIEEKTWQSLHFFPEFTIGKIGIGLDLILNFEMYRWPTDAMGFYPRAADWVVDKDGDGRPDPWTKDSLQEYIDLYASKISYLRYGIKGDPLFIKFGLLDNVSLGNGFIMGGYSNALLRPEYKYVGFQFDFDGSLVKFPYIGLESVFNSISSFDTVGLRLYSFPLIEFNHLFVKDIELGISFVFDNDPYIFFRRIDNTHSIQDEIERNAVIAFREEELKNYEDSSVFIWGIDFRQPLIQKSSITTLDVFGDFVMQGFAPGVMTGVDGNFLQFGYEAQIRAIGANFQPVYFDNSYDLRRIEKLKTYLLNTKKHKNNENLIDTPSMLGWFFSLGTSFFDQALSFYSSLEGPFGKMSSEAQKQAIAWPKFKANLLFDLRTISPAPFAFTGFYEKEFIKQFKDISSPEDALVGVRLLYQMGAAYLQLTYNLKFIPEERRVKGEKSWEVNSKLEAVIHLK